MKTNVKKNMKQAAIDQILLWLVMITIFVSFLFFVIDYSTALRIKDNVDSLADYGARMTALGKSEAEVVEGLNNIRLGSFSALQEADLSCTEVSNSNHQVQFVVQTTFVSDFLSSTPNNVVGKTVVFNEVNDLEKSCSITLTFN